MRFTTALSAVAMLVAAAMFATPPPALASSGLLSVTTTTAPSFAQMSSIASPARAPEVRALLVDSALAINTIGPRTGLDGHINYVDKMALNIGIGSTIGDKLIGSPKRLAGDKNLFPNIHNPRNAGGHILVT